MKMWIIIAVIAGLLLFAGIALVQAINSDNKVIVDSANKCSACNNECTTTNNCGLATCRAVNEKTCGCGG